MQRCSGYFERNSVEVDRCVSDLITLSTRQKFSQLVGFRGYSSWLGALRFRGYSSGDFFDRERKQRLAGNWRHAGGAISLITEG